MKDRIRDILIAIIGLIVFPLSLLIEVISWIIQILKERIKWKKIKKEIIQRNKKYRNK